MDLVHTGVIDIAVARNRKVTKWKNRQLDWRDLVRKISTTHRTHETLGEYLKSTKDRQDQIKDIGGFVGGYLVDGVRKNGHVKHRQLITLDIDLASAEFWDDFQMLYSNCALIYSTHKHQPESPRLRLLMPLDKPVTPEQYEAIARRIASVLGIEQFDHTTYQPARLMYWPSTAKDAEYVFHVQDGPWLKADEMLATYTDWTDSSEWPVSMAENESVKRLVKRQGDPLEKPGIVGAFCRTYTIPEVIELFLQEQYEDTDLDGRYTYRHGSTSGGLVIYEDKYAYSHHGTDPVSAKLCNAFDLVRLHLYADLDDEDTDVPVNKRASYAAMGKLAMGDVKVKRQLGEERMQRAKDDFGVDMDPEEDSSWLEKLDVDDKGNYRRTIENVVLILENDPRIKGRIVRNAFMDKDMVVGQVPWRKVARDTRYFTDIDITGIRHYLERVYGIDHKQKTLEAIEVVLYRHRYHPVKDYLEGLEWDGVPRVDTLLADYLGAELNDYTMAVTRKTLVAAVTRIMQPGAKFDYVLTLVGAQGAGKSSLISRLGREWYCENLTTVQGKDASEQLRGVWLMEMGELAGLKKAEVEIIKNFISRQEDSYRPAYGIKKETYPRQCIFIGTTNNDDFLRDPTGNRRFWPVPIGVNEPALSVHDDLTAEVVGQIWAEAMGIYQEGEEQLYLRGEVEEYARRMQERHTEKDARMEVIQKYLGVKLPEDWESRGIYERRAFLQGDELQADGTRDRETVTVAEIWTECLGGAVRDMTTHNTKPLHDIMRKMPGWNLDKQRRRVSGYGVQRTYMRRAVK